MAQTAEAGWARAASPGAIPSVPGATTPYLESDLMMDTQRIIAFVVFSCSALLLWDAWQKHSAPIFFSSRRRHTILTCDWSSDVCSSDLTVKLRAAARS